MPPFWQVNPAEQIPLLVLIEDTTDTATYYPQAVLKDTKNGTIYQTLNLTQDSSNTRRYTGTLTMPTFAGPQPLYLDCVTDLYTDSGRTTKSATYPERAIVFAISRRWSWELAGGAGGGGFGNFDWKRLEKMLNARLQSHMPQIKREIVRGKGPNVASIVSAVESAVAGEVRASRAQFLSQAKLMREVQKKLMDMADLINTLHEKATAPPEVPVPGPSQGLQTLHGALHRKILSEMLEPPSPPVRSPVDISMVPINRTPSKGVVPLHKRT